MTWILILDLSPPRLHDERFINYMNKKILLVKTSVKSRLVKNSFSAIIVTGQWKNELLYANGTKFCELPDFPDLRAGHSQA